MAREEKVWKYAIEAGYAPLEGRCIFVKGAAGDLSEKIVRFFSACDVAVLQMCENELILLVTDGRGWYQEWGREAQALRPGDCVTIPANVKHWHGAAKDSWMSHVAFEVCGTGMSNEWCEPVSNEEYLKL